MLSDTISMVALNFQGAFPQRTSGAAEAFELTQTRVPTALGQASYDGHGLAAAAAAFSVEAYHAIIGSIRR